MARRSLSPLAPALLLATVGLAPSPVRAEGLALEVPERAAALELQTPSEGDGGFLLALAEPPLRFAEPPLRLAELTPSADGAQAPDLAVRPPGTRVALAPAKSQKSDASSMDFDLLGDAPKPAIRAEDPSLRTRRKMLNWHQGLGIGLFATQLASTVTGQLNYSDKFGVANTGRYKATHRGLVYLNLAEFAVVGGIALFAPTEKGAPPRPFGRTTVHKIGMALATIGMLTQGYLGIRTAQREGYLDKQTYGRAHLAVGYATLAAMSVAVGAIVF